MRIAIAGALGILLFVSPAPRAHAVDLAPPQGPYEVELRVGDVLKICLTGKILCPALAPICDDPRVATPVDTPDGVGFRAVGPGTTLCGAQGAKGTTGRPVWRVTVR